MTKLKAIFAMLLCLGLLLTSMPASFATEGLSEIEDPTAAEDAVIPITPDIPAAPDPTEGAYEYPITPWKTPEIWKAFDNNVDKINACQIPEEVLAKLTTLQLIVTCARYPLGGNCLAFDTRVHGFEFILDCYKFNGIQELLRREDLAEALIEYYKTVPASELTALPGEDPHNIKGLRLLYSEILLEYLAEKDILTVGEMEKIYTARAARTDIYNEQMFCLAQDPVEAVDALFEEKCGTVTTPGEIAEPQDYSTTIYTIAGTAVTAVYITTEYSPSQIAQLNAYWNGEYPNAQRKRDASRLYNGFSYAFHSQSTNNHIWLNDATIYMSDGSYLYNGAVSGKQIPFPSLTNTATVVYYRQSSHPSKTHAARIHRTSKAQVYSKWGDAGLYLHEAYDCPYYYNDTILDFYRYNSAYLT